MLKYIKRALCISLSFLLLLGSLACSKNSQTDNNEGQVSNLSSIQSVTSKNQISDNTSSVDKRYEVHSIYKDELEDTKLKLIEAQAEGGFSYIMLTDMHIDYTGGKQPERTVIEREIAAVIELANTAEVDCIILGGDLLHGTKSYSASLKDLEYYADIFSKSKMPVYTVRGNHDCNDYHGTPCPMDYIITQKVWNDTVLKPLAGGTEVHDTEVSDSTYYYADFEAKKIRLVVLDPYNYPVVSTDGINCDYTAEKWNKVDDRQLDWLASVAFSPDKDGWQYYIVSHAPIIGSETFGNCSTVERIISALNNGGKYTLTDGTVIDYSGYKSSAPLNTSGHTHVNAFKYSNASKFLSLVTGSGKVSYYANKLDYYENRYNADWVYHPFRDFEYISEATFDAITVSPSGEVTRIAFGAGEDNYNLSIAGYKK